MPEENDTYHISPIRLDVEDQAKWKYLLTMEGKTAIEKVTELIKAAIKGVVVKK